MGYFDGLYQGRFESQTAIKKANKAVTDWQAYARQLEAEIREYQLALQANKIVLAASTNAIKQLDPANPLAKDDYVLDAKKRIANEERAKKGW